MANRDFSVFLLVSCILFGFALSRPFDVQDNSSCGYVEEVDNATFCNESCHRGYFDSTLSQCCRERCQRVNKKICYTIFEKQSETVVSKDTGVILIEETATARIFSCPREYDPQCSLVEGVGAVQHYNLCMLCEDLIHNVDLVEHTHVDMGLCEINMMMMSIN